jgi:hypothetical protein
MPHARGYGYIKPPRALVQEMTRRIIDRFHFSVPDDAALIR